MPTHVNPSINAEMWLSIISPNFNQFIYGVKGLSVTVNIDPQWQIQGLSIENQDSHKQRAHSYKMGLALTVPVNIDPRWQIQGLSTANLYSHKYKRC